MFDIHAISTMESALKVKMSQHEHRTFSNLPHLDRQLILVAHKEFTQASKEESGRQGASLASQEFDWRSVGINLLCWTSPLYIGLEAYKAWSRARESGVAILPISREQASELRFSPGHPREGVVYVGHPTVSNIYFALADFHRIMFEQKFCEAVELLMGLGATKIIAEYVSGWSKDFAAKISMPLATAPASGGASVQAESASNTKVLFEATLPGGGAPALPDSLIWYPHEPTWGMLARGRLYHGLQDFSLSVSYLDDFGVNAGLKVNVAKAGLELGGKFEDHVATVWRIHGQFG